MEPPTVPNVADLPNFKAKLVFLAYRKMTAEELERMTVWFVRNHGKRIKPKKVLTIVTTIGAND